MSILFPVFPTFKSLEISDAKIIQEFTGKYEPYSDFNFISLYTWNGDNAEYSFLNDNLVIRMIDYDQTENELIYSILGDKNIPESLDELFKLTKALKFVPEVTLTALGETSNKYTVTEDRDNFDYIYDVKKITDLSQSSLRKKRQTINKFRTTFPDHRVSLLNRNSISIKQDMLSLLDKWYTSKEFSKDEISASKDKYERIFAIMPQDSFILTGIHIGAEIKGFWLNEIIDDKYTLAHFQVSDKNYAGLSETLLYETAKSVPTELYNLEQDSGLGGLRIFKESWKPVKMLKKYIITQ